MRGWIGRNQTESPNMKQHTCVPDSVCSRLAGALASFLFYLHAWLGSLVYSSRDASSWVDFSAFSSLDFRHRLAHPALRPPPSPPRPCARSLCFSVTQTNRESHSRGRGQVLCSTASFLTEHGIRVAFLQQLVACAAPFGQTGRSA